MYPAAMNIAAGNQSTHVCFTLQRSLVYLVRHPAIDCIHRHHFQVARQFLRTDLHFQAHQQSLGCNPIPFLLY